MANAEQLEILKQGIAVWNKWRAWEDDSKFDDMFRRLIDELELFYKG
jgi:hypothetical protein